MTYFNNTQKEAAFYGSEHVLRGNEEYWTKNATARFKAGFERLNGNQPVDIDKNDEKFVITPGWYSNHKNDCKAMFVNPALLPDGMHADIHPPYLSTETSPYTSNINLVVERAVVDFYRLIVKWGATGIAWRTFNHVLADTKTELTNCFKYFDDKTQVPRIVDEQTFKFGVMLYDQLIVIKTGSGIPSEYTTMAEKGLPILEARLKFYEAHRSVEQINQTLVPLLERNHRTARWHLEKAHFLEDTMKDAVISISNKSEGALMAEEIPALNDMIATIEHYMAYLEEKNRTFAAFNREQDESLATLPINITVSDYMLRLAAPEAREEDKIQAWLDLFNSEPSMYLEEIQAPLKRQTEEGIQLCQARIHQIKQLQPLLAQLRVCREKKLQITSSAALPIAQAMPVESMQQALNEVRKAADEAQKVLNTLPEGNPERIQRLLNFITGTSTIDPKAKGALEEKLALEKNKVQAKEAQKKICIELESNAQLAHIATQLANLRKTLDTLGQPVIDAHLQSLLIEIDHKPLEVAIDSLLKEAEWMQRAKCYLNGNGIKPRDLISRLEPIQQCWDTWRDYCRSNPPLEASNSGRLLEEYGALETAINIANQQVTSLQNLHNSYEEILLQLRLQKLDKDCKSLLERINALSPQDSRGINHAAEIGLRDEIQKQLTAIVQFGSAYPGKEDQIHLVSGQYESRFLSAQSRLTHNLEFEHQTHQKLSALYKAYFQKQSAQLGVFWQYLKDRNEKYKHRDWVSSFFHWAWTPEKEARQTYIHALETVMKSLCMDSEDLPDLNTIEALQTLIAQGIERFHPRSCGREQSLVVRLEGFQTALNDIINLIKTGLTQNAEVEAKFVFNEGV